jgi:hypothetical protein
MNTDSKSSAVEAKVAPTSKARMAPARIAIRDQRGQAGVQILRQQ